MSGLRISAVICTYRRYDTLSEAIDSLTKQALPPGDFEIIVVDNSPDRDASLKFGSRYSDVKNLLWVHEQTSGLSNARNVGAEAASSPFVAFMDDDAVAEPGWLAAIGEAFEQFGENAAVVGGKVNPIWGAPRPSWLPDDLLGWVSVIDWGGETRIAGEREWLAGTNIAFRVSALQAIGGFSTELGRKGNGHSLLSNEEIDVVGKLRSLGRLVLYAPRAVVNHLVEPARLTQAWFRRRVVWQAISDFMRDDPLFQERLPSAWTHVLQFVNGQAPKDRSMRAFYVTPEEPEAFKEQIAALYSYTSVLLTGFNSIES